MKKNNTKVELKKYLSQKEKIKNTFISSCIILVILTFFIFITYSYFIKDSGEINVGDTYAAIPDVEIISIKRLENTNNQQYIYKIKNNSNTNTYSYSLNWKDKSAGHFGKVYYKIPNEEYSHSEGIIKPNEEKNILLVTENSLTNKILGNKYDETGKFIGTNGPWIYKVFSGFQYSKPKREKGYEKIKYSPLSETTELLDLKTSDGVLKYKYNNDNVVSGFIKTKQNYDLLFSIYPRNGILDTNINNDNKTNSLALISNLSNNGKITGSIINLNKEGEINHEIKVYAEDGTYVKSYYIDNAYRMAGNINYLELTDSNGFTYGEVTSKETNGFNPKDCINFNIKSEISTNTWKFYITFADGNYYLDYSSKNLGYYSARLQLQSSFDVRNSDNETISLGSRGTALKFTSFPSFSIPSKLYLYVYFNSNSQNYEISRYCINAIKN